MEKPLVSIITPTFNHEKYIAECINSVRAQSYTNWEMIVIDDFSEDSTRDVVCSLIEKDRRIKLIRHRINYGETGLAETYNEAFNMSSGDLIAILEGDDYWVKHKLQTQVKVFRDNDVVLSYADFDEISGDGQLIAKREYKVDDRFLKTISPQNITFLSRLKSFGANTVVIKRAALQRIGGFAVADIPLVDYPTYLQLSLEGTFVRIPITLGFWRRHYNSIFFNKRLHIIKKAAKYFKDYISEHKEMIIQDGLSIEKLSENVQEALQWYEVTAPFFEGKYQLLFGENKRARYNFITAFISTNIPLKHKVGAFIGLVASFFPPKCFRKINRFAAHCSNRFML